MSDIRNKLAKIERAAAEKRAFASFMRSGCNFQDGEAAARHVSDEKLDLELLLQPLPDQKKTRKMV